MIASLLQKTFKLHKEARKWGNDSMPLIGVTVQKLRNCGLTYESFGARPQPGCTVTLTRGQPRAAALSRRAVDLSVTDCQGSQLSTVVTGAVTVRLCIYWQKL